MIMYVINFIALFMLLDASRLIPKISWTFAIAAIGAYLFPTWLSLLLIVAAAIGIFLTLTKSDVNLLSTYFKGFKGRLSNIFKK
jgi:hypothetical protein